jgi:O-antigen/teichoic acid export membrane protein
VRHDRRVQRWMPQGEFARGVLTLVGGSGLAQGIAIASAPVLTRLYSPTEFGIYAVAAATVSILVTVASLSYQFAIPLPDSDTRAANVLGLSLVTALGMSAMTAVVLVVTGPQVLVVLGAPELGPYVPLLAIGQVGGAFVVALSFWAVRTKAFSALATTSLTQSASLVGFQLGFGAVGMGALGLLLGDIIGRFSGMIRLARIAWHTNRPALVGVSRPGMAAAARRYRRFPLFSLPSSIVNVLGLQAPLLLLVALYGAEVGGQFALADRLAGLPVTLLAGAVGRVYFAEGARVARERPAELRALFVRTTRSLAKAAIGPFALLALFAPLIAGFVFGEEWAQAGLFVTILAPMYFVVLVTNPTGSTLDFLERQDVQLALGVFRVGLLSGAVVVASALQLPPVGAVGLLSIAGSLTYAAFGLGSWRAILVRAPVPPRGDDTSVARR